MSGFTPLFQRLYGHAAARPEALALGFGKTVLTYAELVGRVSGSAHALRRAGLMPGDRVFLCAENSIEAAVSYFAIHAAGAVACVLPPDTPEDAVADLVERAQPRFVLTDRPSDAWLDRMFPFSDAIADAPPEIEIAPDDPADILFTSGTTGRRKGVVLSHRNVAAAGRNISAFVGNRDDDIEALPLPLSHSFGLGRLRSMAWVGNAVLLTRGLADVPGLLRLMLNAHATGIALVPAGVEIVRRTLGDHLGRLGGQLRYMEIGSAPMAAETRDWLRRTLPTTRIVHHYGLTEASRAAFRDFADAEAPAGAVGKPSPNVAIEIVGEAGEPLPTGQVGEIVIRGDVVAQAYLDSPAEAQARLGNGRMRSGDSGFLDADGYVHLAGRLDDMINVGGKKVSPGEVEAALLAVDGVSDAAAVGAPDPQGLLGEVVVAVLVASRPLDAAAIAAQVESRLPSYARPARYRFVDMLPRTSSGKLQRYLLRETA